MAVAIRGVTPARAVGACRFRVFKTPGKSTLKFQNSTPFPAFLHREAISGNRLAAAAILRATYDIETPCKASTDQPWLVSPKPWVGPRGAMECDAVFDRDGCDVLLLGEAAPSGRSPVVSLDVSIELGDFTSGVRVFGDRSWVRQGEALVPSEPASFSSMPLGLERAYGGVALFDELPTPFADNPKGRGFYLEEAHAEGGPLPNVEAPERLIKQWDDRPEPAGVGFCPVGFGPRAQRAAVIRGDRVVQVRSAINNVAFPALVCPTPKLDAQVVLRGMGPELRFHLPSEPIVAVTRVADAEYEDVMRIDQITRVTVQRLVFLDDHKMLTDIDHTGEDWRRGGKRYVEKQGGAHWLSNGHSYPASVTKATRLTIEIDLAVESADADPIECKITAIASLPAGDSGAPKAFTFETSAVLGGQPTARLRLVATEPLADQVFLAADWTLKWSAEAAARTFDMGRTGPHRLYVTFGTPDPAGHQDVTPYGNYAPPLEDGITDKRMDAAVVLAENQWRTALPVIAEAKGVSLDKNDPHDLVWALNTSVLRYTLTPDPTVPPEFNHPKYFEQKPGPWQGGAWPVIKYREKLAECQAIVRCMRAIILQIGLPDRAEFVVVYAHEQVGGGATALVDSVIPSDSDASKYGPNPKTGGMGLAAGLHRDHQRIGLVGGVETRQVLGLVGGEVAEGQFFPEGSVLNSYEACLKFTHAGKTRYYAGGVIAERYETIEQVLVGVFWALVWSSTVKTAGVKRTRIDEIVHRYQKTPPP